MRKYIFWIPLITVFAACAGVDNTERPYQGPDAPKSLFAKKEKKHKVLPSDINFVKELQYDKYTLEDVYPYKDTTRRFQWNKIRNKLVIIEEAQLEGKPFGVLQNKNNSNGEGALVKEWSMNEYKRPADKYGYERYQSIPLYDVKDTITPERYANDGAWVIVEGTEGGFTKIKHVFFEGEWFVQNKYLKQLDSTRFDRVVTVDRENQNICTLEKTDSAWMVRSMNPCTTGAHNPPYGHPTPLGIFVVQEKKPKMYYYHDGTTNIAGYAPWASRFCQGGYTHGVPTNNPNAPIIEYSWTLGTTPRSHMCVRNASSHAKFIYDWAPVFKSLVIVIE